jgi:hypothetical protein
MQMELHTTDVGVVGSNPTSLASQRLVEPVAQW